MSARNGTVKTGIDVLEEHGFDVLKWAAPEARSTLALVTNQTGLDASRQAHHRCPRAVPGVSLDAIFSPEHGVTGTLDTTDINNSKDAATGVPSIACMEGAMRRGVRRPRCCAAWMQSSSIFRMLAFASTPTKLRLGYFLESAAKAGIEMFVLDRPNPITGSFVQGPPPTPDMRASRITGPCPCVTE